MFDRNICFGGHAVHLIAGNTQINDMFDFMFNDIPAQDFKHIEIEFSLNEYSSGWEVLKQGKRVYHNNSLTDAANFLMGEVVFHLIEHNQQFMAIHAALLSNQNGGILLPGESGNGKSSLSIWMTLNGFRYHTDELVLIKSGSLETQVFTRPFNIKRHGVKAINSILDLDTLEPPAETGDFITMIPHRALNPDFTQQSPPINRIIYPRYKQAGENELLPLSPAAAGIELMKTHVIARNLPGHGFKQLLDIVKAVPSHMLHYNHFDALPALLKDI